MTVDKLYDNIIHNNITGVKEWISSGADINYMNLVNKNTALSTAAAYNSIDVVKLLLKQPGIDVNVKTNTRSTPLIRAAIGEYHDVIELLLMSPKIEVDIKDTSNYNFIDWLNDKKFLTYYTLQNTILKNNREDIILFLNQYGLIHQAIKEENESLFKVADWGLSV